MASGRLELPRSKLTSGQVPRDTQADAEHFNIWYLFKRVGKLRATYQIRLLAFRAVAQGTQLILAVPRECEFDASLLKLMKIAGKTISRVEL